MTGCSPPLMAWHRHGRERKLVEATAIARSIPAALSIDSGGVGSVAEAYRCTSARASRRALWWRAIAALAAQSTAPPACPSGSAAGIAARSTRPSAAVTFTDRGGRRRRSIWVGAVRRRRRRRARGRHRAQRAGRAPDHRGRADDLGLAPPPRRCSLYALLSAWRRAVVSDHRSPDSLLASLRHRPGTSHGLPLSSATPGHR